jgi:hypothetical protein
MQTRDDDQFESNKDRVTKKDTKFFAIVIPPDCRQVEISSKTASADTALNQMVRDGLVNIGDFVVYGSEHYCHQKKITRMPKLTGKKQSPQEKKARLLAEVAELDKQIYWEEFANNGG